jgi:outer membrane protein TolC
MIKFILPITLLCSIGYAENFETFLARAVQNSTYIQSSYLTIEQSRLEGKIIKRYENPKVELEASSFESENGYRVAIAQPIRLWEVSVDKEHFATSKEINAKANASAIHAQFVKEISFLYAEYSQKQKLLDLANEELKIAQKIDEISNQRFLNGSLSKALMLQANVDYANAQSNVLEYERERSLSNYNLLAFAGVAEELQIEPNYQFRLINNEKENPDISLLESENAMSVSESKLNTYTLESIEVFGEYEREGNQNIYRAGVSIALPFFNDKSEEKSILSLQERRSALALKAYKNRLQTKTVTLKKELDTLNILLQKRQSNLKNEEELMNMYNDAYAIATINILELYEIKNRVLSTKREVINLQAQIDRATIEYNYTQGNYNE